MNKVHPQMSIEEAEAKKKSATVNRMLKKYKEKAIVEYEGKLIPIEEDLKRKEEELQEVNTSLSM